MLYTYTLYSGRTIWDEVLKDPKGLLAEEVNRRYCTNILGDIYVPNFNLDDEYYIEQYNGDWGFAGIRLSKEKCKLNRATKFHGGTPRLIIRKESL